MTCVTHSRERPTQNANPQATALAVKDDKFIYVGDEAGLSAYEGEVTDLGGKQVMVFDEFDIHTAKESELKIVDWEKTYFLTNYYF